MSFFLKVLLLTLILPVCTLANQHIPIIEFAKPPVVQSPKLSTDGSKFAYLIRLGDRNFIEIKDFDDLFKKSVKPSLVGFDKGEVEGFIWANDERLIVNVQLVSEKNGRSWRIDRLASVGPDGKDVKYFKIKPNYGGYINQFPTIENLIVNDPLYVLAELDAGYGSYSEIYRVNVYTGERTLATSNNKSMTEYMADDNGDIRIAQKWRFKKGSYGIRLMYRKTPKDSWREIQNAMYSDKNRIIPYRFDEDDYNILLVQPDSQSLRYWDDEVDRKLFRYDLSANKVLGAYKNIHRENVFSAIKRSFPNYEFDIISNNRSKNKYVFRAYTDIDPPKYYLFNLNEKTIDYLASEFPSLDNTPLSNMHRITYMARDGLEVPAFLTLPEGYSNKNLPLIVFPHDGPWSSDRWGFDRHVQFLASRGYAVLQPQFRGSTGYGHEFEKAGYGEWGKSIINDINDSVQPLIEDGTIDDHRICIMGEGLGAYNAFHAAIKDKKIYKCIVSIEGVFDIKKLIFRDRHAGYERSNREMWSSEREAKKLSPYKLVEDIEAPVLLIATEQHTSIDIKHSEGLYKKLKKNKKKVEFVKLEEKAGSSAGVTQDNELIKLQAIEAFLSENIGDFAK